MKKLNYILAACLLTAAHSKAADLQLLSGFTFGNTNGVDLFFNEAVPVGATDVENYTLTSGTTIVPITAAIQVEPKRVRLTAPTPEGFLYTLSASNFITAAAGSIPSNQVTFTQWEGFTTRQFFLGINGNDIAQLTNSTSFTSNTPELTDFPSKLEILRGEPAGASDGNGSRTRFYFNPTMSGPHLITAKADDEAMIFVSTDDNPANKQLIAYIVDPIQQIEPTAFIFQAGSRYYMEVLHKSGGGPNYLQINISGPNELPTYIPIVVNGAPDVTPKPSGPAYLSRFGYRLGNVVLLTVPSNKDVAARSQVIFSATAEGALPHRFQWYKNGVAIEGATSSIYQIDSVPASDNSSLITVEVSNEFSKAVSAPATLTVQPEPIVELTLERRENTLQISWPGVAFGSTLESSETLLPNSWTPIDESTNLISIEVPTTTGHRFYRLRAP